MKLEERKDGRAQSKQEAEGVLPNVVSDNVRRKTRAGAGPSSDTRFESWTVTDGKGGAVQAPAGMVNGALRLESMTQ